MKTFKLQNKQAKLKSQADQDQDQVKRERLINVLVELAPGYGYRTVKKLLKYVNGTKVPDLPIRTYPTKQQANGYKGHALRELKEYGTGRYQALRDLCEPISTNDLDWVLKNLGKTRLEMRYGSRQFSGHQLGKPELDADREIETALHYKRRQKWEAESRKRAKQRREEQLERLRKEKALKRKRAKARREAKPITLRSYVKQVKQMAAALTMRFQSAKHQ